MIDFMQYLRDYWVWAVVILILIFLSKREPIYLYLKSKFGKKPPARNVQPMFSDFNSPAETLNSQFNELKLDIDSLALELKSMGEAYNEFEQNFVSDMNAMKRTHSERRAIFRAQLDSCKLRYNGKCDQLRNVNNMIKIQARVDGVNLK